MPSSNQPLTFRGKLLFNYRIFNPLDTSLRAVQRHFEQNYDFEFNYRFIQSYEYVKIKQLEVFFQYQDYKQKIIPYI